MSQSLSENQDVVFTKELPPSREKLHARIAALGQKLSGEQFDEVYARIHRLHELKHDVYLAEIKAIVEESVDSPSDGWTLVGLKTAVGSNVVSGASVVLKDPNGKVGITESVGENSIDAIYLAIQQATHVHVFLRDFTYGNVTSGANALGKATVKVEHHGRLVTAKAYSVDILEAAAKAFLYAVNIIISKLEQ